MCASLVVICVQYQFNVLCLSQLNELVVGDTSGKLYIYKNDDPKPWITRTCVGMVSNINDHEEEDEE